MNVLVTGAAGFIGSHVAEALLTRGDNVTGLDNFNDYYDPARKRANVKPALSHLRYRLVEGDVRDERLLADLCAHERFDKICHLYGLHCTGLRFFTVYGPRGRPDMAPYLFTKWISEEQPVRQFGDGSSQRDYTFIADIVTGVVAALDADLPYEIINLGRGETVKLVDFIQVVEEIVGRSATIVQEPPQPGNVPRTYADITKARDLLDYNPTTSVAEGMHRFWAWYRAEILKPQ